MHWVVFGRILVLATTFAALPLLSAAAEPEVVRLPFKPEDNGGWVFKGDGLFEGWTDHRELFVLHHPWAGSESNRSGSVSREAQVPAHWPGRRVRLGFYMSDDYFGSDAKVTNGWLGQIKLVGHRFKQVLADDEVIWERDVADHNHAGDPANSVLLPERVKPGSRVRIAFRLIDKVASSQRLPEDHRFIGATDNIQSTNEWRFKTDVFVGDVTLIPDGLEPPHEEPPTANAVRSVHDKRWPLKPYGQPVNYPVALSWEQHDDLDGRAWPIHCGVPLAAGMARDARQVVLSDQLGQRLPLQARPMNRWSDGSLRWVELDALAPATIDTRKLMLDIRQNGGSPSPPLSPAAMVTTNSNRVTLKGSNLEVVLGGDTGCLVRSIRSGTSLVEHLVGEIEMDGKVYRPITETTRVLAEGPVRAEAELSGFLKADGPPMGRFVFRLAVFSGQPFVRLTWRIFNDRPGTLRVSRFELLAQSSLASGSTVRWGGSGKTAQGSIRLCQPAEKRFEVRNEAGTVIDSGASSAGWLAAVDTNQTLQVLVRYFQQQFPKALEIRRGHWRLALFEPAPNQPFFEPTEGEAKQHEIWLGLWDRAVEAAELERCARYFTRPARLFDAAYFCASGGFGYAAPHNGKQFADFDFIVTNLYGNISADKFYVNGIRNWGDYPYGSAPKWCNGYYNAQQGMASEYLMSGQPLWFDHLEATVRHIIDIDICHSFASQPGWVGSIHHGHEGPDHAGAGPWCPTQRTWGTLAYWRLSGDLDAREAALGVADSALRTKRGLGSTSVRDHAGILYCLTAAYDETYDRKYLEAARELAHDAMKRIDRRRGCYAEVHGNLSYRGNVPWMCAQLAEPMYYYYRQSGDVEAAIAVAGLAESILTEDCTRNVPGDVFGYSHNPHFVKTAGYHVLIAPTVFYAYELTGDEFYLKHGRAMWAQMLKTKEVNSVRNCYWLAPTLLYYMQSVGF